MRWSESGLRPSENAAGFEKPVRGGHSAVRAAGGNREVPPIAQRHELLDPAGIDDYPDDFLGANQATRSSGNGPSRLQARSESGTPRRLKDDFTGQPASIRSDRPFSIQSQNPCEFGLLAAAPPWPCADPCRMAHDLRSRVSSCSNSSIASLLTGVGRSPTGMGGRPSRREPKPEEPPQQELQQRNENAQLQNAYAPH